MDPWKEILKVVRRVLAVAIIFIDFLLSNDAARDQFVKAMSALPVKDKKPGV